jgi:aryl-alcohol dehydrogenase-like predicted oxidoreductase
LKTDYIDIYFLHRFDDLTPLEETLRALEDLVHQQGALFGCQQFAAWQVSKKGWVFQQKMVGTALNAFSPCITW